MKSPEQWSDLRARMLSASAMILIGLLGIWLGGVVFHLLVALNARDIAFDDVLTELDRREGRSGIDEKAARKS